MNEGTAADVTAAHGGRSRQSKKHSKTYRSISAILSWLTARRPTTLSTSLRARFLPYLLTLAIAWLPWLILTWPGSMRDDTLAQYLQSSGLHHYYTQHPLFDTLTFGLFWHIGSALGSPLIGQALYTVTQAVLLAAGCALLLCYIRKIGSPRWLIGLGLVYLATNYVVVGAITTMGKDSLHAVFYLPLAVLFVEACLTRGSVLARRPVAFAFVILLFATIVSKRTALIIVLCGGCCLLAVCTPKGARRRVFACLAVAIVVAQGVWTPLSAAATHANRSPGREVWGLVTQPVARLAHDDPSAIDKVQRRRLNAIMDLDWAAAGINPHRTDETFRTLREHPRPTAAQQLAALQVWVQLGLAHPVEYATAYAGVTRGWWDPRVNFAYPTDSDYLFTPGYLRQWASFLTEGAWKHTSDGDADTVAAERLAAIEHDLAPLRGTSDKPQWQKNILRAIHRWVRSDGRVGVRKGNLLTSMALYVTWIPLAAGLALVVRPARRRYGPALAAYGLLAFTVLSLYASPVALFWYPIPVFLALPLFVVLPFTFRESHPL